MYKLTQAVLMERNCRVASHIRWFARASRK